jgi:hypothetical protein
VGFKDKQRRTLYNREYMRKRRLAMTEGERQTIREQQIMHKREWLAAMTLEEKKTFYKNRHRRHYLKYAWRYAEVHRILRKLVIDKLGGKCSNPFCGWINEDDSKGCIDVRCLQIDHKRGDGVKDRKACGTTSTFLRKVLKDNNDSYQLLCSNCNWIKRVENKEYMKSKHVAPTKEAA